MGRTIEISVSEEQLRLIDEKAQQFGLEREQYVSVLLLRDLADPPSLDRILHPLREQVTASGVTDEELAQLLGEAREDLHRERRR